jgi:hypothetical protein
MKTLVGMKWHAVFIGKKSMNGAPHSQEYTGEVLDTEGSPTIYEFIKRIAGYTEKDNAEMEIIESVQISVSPYLEDDTD